MLIRKTFKAEMAHSVPGAFTTRCRYLHGHSYKFEVFLRSDRPNASHMVSDFQAVKEMGLRDLFDSLDHAVMVWEKDSLARVISDVNPERYLIVPFVPTAEMLAKAFFFVSAAIVKAGPGLSGEEDVHVERVVVHETETGLAAFGEEDLSKDRFPDISFDRWIISKGIQSSWKNPGWFKKAQGTLSPAAVKTS